MRTWCGSKVFSRMFLRLHFQFQPNFPDFTQPFCLSPITVLALAILYHFMSVLTCRHDVRWAAMACLFLATKLEEVLIVDPMKKIKRTVAARDVLRVFKRLDQVRTPPRPGVIAATPFSVVRIASTQCCRSAPAWARKSLTSVLRAHAAEGRQADHSNGCLQPEIRPRQGEPRPHGAVYPEVRTRRQHAVHLDRPGLLGTACAVGTT